MAEAEDERCLCKHSVSAHGLHGDPGCIFCSCTQFRRPPIAGLEIALSRYGTKALDLLTKSPAFREIPKDALIAMVEDGHGRVYGPGAYLIRRGDTSSMLHIILAGGVSVETEAETPGAKPDVTVLEAGAIAGDLGAFSDQARWASVSADDSVEALEIDVKKLRHVFRQYPELLMALAQTLAQFSASADELVNATVSLALEQLAEEPQGTGSQAGLDPGKAADIRSRWLELKEKDAADRRAREAARAAIDR